MLAVGVYEYGGPEALRVLELPTPHAGPGEIRVRVSAAAVNPADTLIRLGDAAAAFGSQPPPYIPGMDAAGLVDEIGPGCETELLLGARVMAMVMPIRAAGGAYAEYVVLPASWVAPAPTGTSHAEAATLPMNGLTARMALDMLALAPGQRLAVTGGAGVLGGYLIQLACAAGLRVFADAAPADQPRVRSLGADVVVDRGEDVAGAWRALAPDGVDAVVDAALLGAPILAAIRDGGALARVRGPGERGVGKLEPEREIVFHQVSVPGYLGDRNRLDALRACVERGQLSLRVAGSYRPEQAPDAHRRLEAGGTRGRLVIEF